jgi:hypothetical protein
MTGIIHGSIKEEIPNSSYDAETKTILIFNPTDTYSYQVCGLDDGVYGLEIAQVVESNSHKYIQENIAISFNETHEYKINWENSSNDSIVGTRNVDANGDGVFEKSQQLEQTTVVSKEIPGFVKILLIFAAIVLLIVAVVSFRVSLKRAH